MDSSITEFDMIGNSSLLAQNSSWQLFVTSLSAAFKLVEKLLSLDFELCCFSELVYLPFQTNEDVANSI